MELIDKCSISETYPEIETSRETFPRISGLQLKTLVGCPECGYVASQKPVQQHMRTHHPASKKALEASVLAQVLNPGVTKKLFRVGSEVSTITTSSDSPSSILDEIKQFSWQSYAAPADVPNARLVSPWLMRTGWHVHVQGHSVEDLHALVTRVDREATPLINALHSAIHQYFEKATDLLEATDELVLQKINTSDSDKT
jgi:bloom syndrome protein